MKHSTSLLLLAMTLFSISPVLAEDTELNARMEEMNRVREAQAKELLVPENKAENKARVTQASTTQTVPASENSLGGYGEISYNRNIKDNSRSQADVRRFVLSFGHRFNDKLNFVSEVEWEHAIVSSGDQGEVEIEQAVINYQISKMFNLKTGLFLMPFGFLNTSHEPPVFNGVERNEIETRIIPTTWREGGLGLFGSTESGLDWDFGITTGFNFAKFDDASSPLRAIHQELQLAKANDPSFYAALNYRAFLGFLVGSSVFTGYSGQGNANFLRDSTKPNFNGINGQVTLVDAHIRWQPNRWDLRALYAQGFLGDALSIDANIQAFNTANAASRVFVPKEFYGWLLEAAYIAWQSGDHSITPFVRYEAYNTQSSMPTGFSADPANADRLLTVGLSYKPIMQIVFKADYQKYFDNSASSRFNLGAGYMF